MPAPWLPEFLPIRSRLQFDHYCAVVLQNVEKACCDNQQRAFSCLGGKCAEPTKFTFHRRSTPPCRSSPTPGAGGSNPFGRTKSSILWVLLFLFFADPRFLCAMPKRPFTVIIRCKCFQQDTFVRTGQFDFSHTQKSVLESHQNGLLSMG